MAIARVVLLAVLCLLAAPASAQQDAPPDPPRRLEAVVVGTAVKLSWRESAGAASYAIERAQDEGEFTRLGVAPEGATYEDAGVLAGARYRYRVLALDAAGRASAPTEPLEVVTLRPPSPVRATLRPVEGAGGAVEVEVRWRDPAPARTDEFRLERRPLGASEAAFERLETLKKRKLEPVEPGVYAFVDAQVDPATTYDYRVIAAAGSVESPPSPPASTPALAAPAAPRDLVAGAFAPGRIALRWRDASRDELGFRVERRRPGAEEWRELAALGPNASSALDEVAPGEAYEYRVLAFNERGASPPSAAVGARTPTRAPAPLGAAGASGIHAGPTAVPDRRRTRPKLVDEHFAAVPDRWRLAFPEWRRGGEAEEGPYEEGSLLNPYTQNVLKGDYPILGNDIFLVVEAQSDTLVEGRSFPFPSGVSTAEPRSREFFGDFDQLLVNQSFVLSAELFQGDTAFRPKDAAAKVTLVGNVNVLAARENNLVDIDPREGEDRLDGHLGIQEALIDKHLLDLGASFDFVTLIAGVQRFQSDFRGFLFADNNLGARLQTNYLSNRLQLNLAWFHPLEKDTNSGLNRYELRDQHVFVANLYVQDALAGLGRALLGHELLGYTLLLSYHLNLDQPDVRYDQNDFLVRPAKIGFASDAAGELRTKEVRVHYLGLGGEGHVGPLNISHQYYLAIGEESFSEVAGREQNVLAHFAALELSVDVDWLRFKASYLYASGDRNPQDAVATGFSAIFDNPFFAGSGFSYFNRQNVPLVQTGVQLTNRLSLLTDMRSSKLEGTSNFVNPGLHLFNVGASARLTPHLFADFNVNFLYFDHTEVLEQVLVQDRIRKEIGVDLNLGVQYRPFLTDNVIFTAGVGALVPGNGFKDVYTSQTLYSGFLAMTLTY